MRSISSPAARSNVKGGAAGLRGRCGTLIAATAVSFLFVMAGFDLVISTVRSWAPNVVIDQLGAGWGPTLAATVRGLGYGDFKATSEPTMTIYLDDVVLGRPTGAILDLLDLERLGSVPAEKAGPLARYAAAIQAQRGALRGPIARQKQGRLHAIAQNGDFFARHPEFDQPLAQGGADRDQGIGLLRRRLDQALAQAGVTPAELIETNASFNALTAVRAGLGVALLEPITAYGVPIDGVTVRPIDADIPFFFGVITPEAKRPSAAVTALINALSRAAQRLLPDCKLHNPSRHASMLQVLYGEPTNATEDASA